MKTKKQDRSKPEPAPDKSYVWEFGDGYVFKDEVGAVLVKAKSERDAYNQFISQLEDVGYYGGAVRLAGDEPRIEAIYEFAQTWYQRGIIDRKIDELNTQRNAVEETAKQFKRKAYQVPPSGDEIPF